MMEEFKGSLSETLVNAGVQAALASKMTKYILGQSTFKLKGDRFGLVLRKDILMIQYTMELKN
jgi:hypothetical protein